MQLRMPPLTAADREEVIDVFNHYVENGFAAFPEERFPYAAYDGFLAMCRGYPSAVVRNGDDELLGFGLLRAYHPLPAFLQTAEVSCFLKPGFTGKGIGTALFAFLTNEALAMGLGSLVASISSLNAGSIRFHTRQGFTECGRIQRAGKKWGSDFALVLMQKMLYLKQGELYNERFGIRAS